VIDPSLLRRAPFLRLATALICRTVASPTSAALAYTCLCVVMLLFALCLGSMPERIVERVAAVAGGS
jgi:hypothetical protein